MLNNVRWLLVGAGAIAGKRVASAIAETGNCELVGVCDVAEESARELAGEYGAPGVFSDVDEAIARSDFDAVYVATPVFLHVPIAIKALEAGKHVLVEKPLGISAEDAGRLVEVAGRYDRLKVGCAYYRRFYPAFAQAKEMLDKGEFGDIVLVRMHYYSWGAMAGDNWRVIKGKSGGGPLSDMGSHMFDVMIGLLGMPETVYAKVQNHVHSYEVEDSAAIVMRMPDSADVVASFHWNSKTWTHEFEIVGTEAKVRWHPYDSGKVVKTIGRDTQELDLANAENVHQPVVADFVEAVLGDGKVMVTPAEALKTNVVLDAVYESAAKGKEIVL